ncbi:4Fe-4S binding protein [Dongshaea marina]|uniref:4Fe-4S binding protein n=1 Tax=Dongshaea marina TaxID=2047966 RepID=UPI00131F122C|nr:4Fe-4S binding protein [Dongshaea marina]
MWVNSVQLRAQLGLQNCLLRLRPAIPYLQGMMLLALVGLLLIPLFGQAPIYQWQTPWNNGQLFSEWVLWGVWYPGTLLSVLLVGRFWCGILCPLGALSEWVSRVGAQFRLPGWLRHPIAPALSFMLVTLWAQTLDVRDDLRSALLLFGVVFALAVGCGLLFGSSTAVGRRAWCRHLCPIGSVLGVFSRLGVMSLELLRPSTTAEGYREQGICPTSIELRTKQSSRHCIKCARCIKPQSRGGLEVTLRRPGTEIKGIERHAPCGAELAFIWFAPGLAIAGFIWSVTPLYIQLRQGLGQWGMSQHWYGLFARGPSWLMNQNASIDQHYLWLDFFSITLFMLGAALVLALLLGACSLLGAWAMGRMEQLPLSKRLTLVGYQFAPLAMLCILLGLGSTLFSSLKSAFGPWLIYLELGLLLMALLFNLWISARWLLLKKLNHWRLGLSFTAILIGCLVISLVTLWSIFPAYQPG